MIKNYLKVFFRNLLRQKGYSLVNILGLSVGIACSILIFLWVRDELGYDNFHLNKNELHLVVQNQNFASGTITIKDTPSALATRLKNDYPEIIDSTRMLITPFPCIIKYGDTTLNEVVNFADPNFFEMFTFPLVKGDQRRVFSDISSILITEKAVQKFFGQQDPLGKVITIIALGHNFNFRISGVIKDIPKNSSLQFNFILPLQFLKNLGMNLNAWGESDFLTFVLLQKNASYKNVTKKIFDLYRRVVNPQNIRDLFLHPLTRMHLYEVDGSGGRIVYVRLFSIIAFFILIIACINFVNLSTGCTANRAGEVGIRKVAGAKRISLIKQFFGESILMVILAMILALVWIILILPTFNTISGKQLSLHLFSPGILLALIVIGIFTCLAAGGYPAVLLSSFQPAVVFRGTGKSGTRKGWLRRILVFIQFSISILLIVSTTVVYKQLHYIQTKDIGMDKENILYIPMRGEVINTYPTMKNEWQKNSNILNVTTTSHLLSGDISKTGGWDWEGENSTPKLLMNFGLFGYDYTDTFKIPMADGRFFSRDYSDNLSVVVNEKAVQAMGMKSPIGKRLSHLSFNKNFKIIGVVKDFQFRSLHHTIQPLVLLLKSEMVNGLINYGHIFIRINPVNIKDTIKYVETIFKKLNHGYTFEYQFLDEVFNQTYQGEQQMGRLTGYGAFLAIFISCLGLLGLSAFMVEQRTKEIAVRKVFGASPTGIVSLFSKEFVRLILVASILGGVIAYYVMTKWLQGFAQRTSFSWWIFLMAAALSLAIALLMISIQTLRAAARNPVDSLKYE